VLRAEQGARVNQNDPENLKHDHHSLVANPRQSIISIPRRNFCHPKVEDSGIPFTILLPANFMQNHLNFGTPETIKAQSAFYSPLGEAKISPIDTRDISAVAAKALVESGHEGKRYDLTGGESFSNAEIAELLSKALG
jgi:nucleoside-diphosphate-sugar epimerase